MTIVFPSAQPTGITSLADALLTAIAPLVTDHDRNQILAELEPIDLCDVASVGFEVTLPPHSPSCDVSVLLSPGLIPPFARDPSLHSLGAKIKHADAGSTWWELDTSDDTLPVGAFIRLLDGVESFALCRSSVKGNPELAAAIDKLEPLVRYLHSGGQGLLGIFPTRQPAAAAALVPLSPDSWIKKYDWITEQVMVSSDAHSPIAQQLTSTCDTVSVAVACDTVGRTAAAVEFAFGDRINAMLEGRWVSAIKRGGWGPWQAGLELLVNTQGVHTFSDFLPMTLITGIDHLKLTPDGRLKAYVGILPIYRGIGINGLAQGTI